MGIISGVVKTYKFITALDAVKNLMRDMKSMRVLFTYLTGGLFTYVILYTLRHYPEAAETVVVTTGSVLTLVFTNYVFSKSADKKLDAMKEMDGKKK